MDLYWLGESLLAIKLNYDVILDHATSFSRKTAVRKIAKPGPVPTSAGASTFAESNNSGD